MGTATVGVFSNADKEALHVSLADESYCIGGPMAADSYLSMKAIISVALATKAQAIHPGYGFLSESAAFAKLCEDNGIVFIGPPADVIAKMGDKDMARKAMQAAGVPVIPGSDIAGSLKAALSEAERIGYPLLIKARSGGGGRGIRLVNTPDEFEKHYQTATAEAQSAFGDGAVYLEKYLRAVKHIEMQVLADNHGNVVCLGERDCSMQRKKQKLIEETPAVTLSGNTRKAMAEVAMKACRAVGYRGAGTFEFLCDEDSNFYFMEMNTRLQVEHPITEMVTGIDLVKWQVRIAAGAPLPFRQEEIVPEGHSIECRINAENPRQNFRPSCGEIRMLHVPGGPWVRFDTAIYQGYRVSPFYDSLIGKLIVYAKTRDEAIRKMKAALCELIVEGIEHDADYVSEVLSAEAFEDGRYTTDFLEASNNVI